MSLESFQFGDEEIQNLMSEVPPPETGSSFTALLELPPNQAVKLLHSPSIVFASMTETTSSIQPSSVKQEPIESGSLHNSSPILSDPAISKPTKRKEREKKVKTSAKKMKPAAKETDREQLPYVHVRARRGEATDSHSLAERARREKINARMKFLQELVPGCNQISGTATVLDEIISHVQSLQRQVEFLSMRLASVDPRIDINLDNLFSPESGSLVDGDFASMVYQSWWPDGVINGITHQLWHPDGLGIQNSLLSYNSYGNSASLLPSQLKMEL